MGRADYEGIVRYSTPDNLAGEAIDTQQMRTMVNNVTHFADEDGQVLVCAPPSTANSLYLGSLAFSGATDPTFVCKFGPFNVRSKSTISAYPIRVRMYADLDTGASTCKAWIVYSRFEMSRAAITNASTNVVYCSPTTTAGWLTSYDPSATAETRLYLTEADMIAGHRQYSTVESIGGNETSVVSAQGTISIWLEGLTGAATFRLYGFYAAEFYG